MRWSPEQLARIDEAKGRVERHWQVWVGDLNTIGVTADMVVLQARDGRLFRLRNPKTPQPKPWILERLHNKKWMHD